jgi:hypothetical protein
MPLPTTFAGVSARGEGLFASQSNISYYFADINYASLGPASQNFNSGSLIGSDLTGNIYVLTYDATNNVNVLSKYNSSYVVQWTVSGLQAWTTFYVDSSGNSYIAGSYQIMCVDTNGTVLWGRNLPSSAFSQLPTISSITTDSSGNVYVYGQYNSTRTGNIRVGYTYYYGLFVIKLDSSGTLIWSSFINNGTTNNLSSITNTNTQLVVDPSGNVYASGHIFTGGLFYPLLWKLNSSGTTISSNYITINTSTSYYGTAGGLAIDPTGQYVYGVTRAQGSSSGTFIYRYNISTSSIDYSNLTFNYIINPPGITCDGFGNVYTFGNGFPITSFNSTLSSVSWQKSGNDTIGGPVFSCGTNGGTITYNAKLGLLVSGYSLNSSSGRAAIFGNVPTNGSKSGYYTISPSTGGTDYATFVTVSNYSSTSILSITVTSTSSTSSTGGWTLATTSPGATPNAGYVSSKVLI